MLMCLVFWHCLTYAVTELAHWQGFIYVVTGFNTNFANVLITDTLRQIMTVASYVAGFNIYVVTLPC